MQVSHRPDSRSPEAGPTVAAAPTLLLDVSGMKCAGCVRAVETQLLQQAGVAAATVNLVTEAAMVQCQPDADPELLAETLAAKLTATGFPTQLRGSEPVETLTPAERQQQETQRQMRQVGVALFLLLFSAVGHLAQFGWITAPGLGNMWLHGGLATLALLFPGRPILIDGWRGLSHNLPNMNTLVGLGTLTAYTASLVALLFPNLGWECFFDEPVMLMGFILLGRALEQQARSRATQSLQALVALQPTVARLVDQTTAQTLEIPASQVKPGEWLQVLPGEKIPVDGEVVAGQTSINEAMLTGEAMPVWKQAGDSVAAGSLNLSGLITLQASRTGSSTTLAQIIQWVEMAQTRKAPIQGLADLVAGYFTYGVMLLALLTFLFWYFVGIPLWSDQIFAHLHSIGHLMQHGASASISTSAAMPMPPSPLLLSLKLAIAVLVIACPCALGLATPTAILVGSSLGAERGLLIRGGDVLETVHQLRTLVFDKTGTLTLGHPTVTDCLPIPPSPHLLQLAASAERGTQHPLALAIQQAAQQANLPLLEAQDFHTEPGLGIRALVEGQPVVVGTADWLQQARIEVDSAAQTQAQTWAAQGKTPVYVAANGSLVGMIAVQDQLRPDAKATIQRLRQMGLKLMMLTGDQPAVAASIAAQLGLAPEEVIADVRPDRKAEVIQQLQFADSTTPIRVAMVGDGINDAPALAQADVGIAMNSGTDVAIETADLILVHNQLSDLVAAIQLSRATFNKIRQNLFWAFIYNALGLPIAAGLLLPSLGIILSPATAGALMAFSSVSVVTNSLLLRRLKAGEEPGLPAVTPD
ncbi:MAG: heavy metal translocating P-type ATPase [Elainella sp.]